MLFFTPLVDFKIFCITFVPLKVNFKTKQMKSSMSYFGFFFYFYFTKSRPGLHFL